MKNIFLFLLILAGRFVDAQDSAGFALKWDEYNWSFEKDFKDFKSGWYEGYDYDSIKKVRINIDFNSFLSFTVAAQDTLGWAQEGFVLDTNQKIGLQNEMLLYYNSGKIKAKLQVLPIFARMLLRSYGSGRFKIDTVAIDDGEGNLIMKVVRMEEPAYKTAFNEYKIIKHGECVYYDTLGNEWLCCQYNFDKLTGGKEALFYRDKLYSGYKEALKEDSKYFQVEYLSKDSISRKEEILENGSSIEMKIWINNLLKYSSQKLSDSTTQERWYMSDGKTIIEEVSRINYKLNGFYFKLNDVGDTLISGVFVNDLKHGQWKVSDTVKSSRHLHTGNYYYGHKIGAHYYYFNGKKYREVKYQEFQNKIKPDPYAWQYSSIRKNADTIICKVEEVFYHANGNLKQVVIYNPHWYSASGSNYYGGVLDGVYTPEQPITIPTFYVPYSTEYSDFYFHTEKQKNYNEKGQISSILKHNDSYGFDGVSLVYDEYGNLQQQDEYHNGMSIGYSYRFNPNGDTIYKKYYVNGLQHGVSITEDEKSTWFYGAETGPYERFQRYTGMTYVGKKFFGENWGLTKVYLNGKLIEEGSMFGYNKDSVWVYYDSLGNVKNTVSYDYALRRPILVESFFHSKQLKYRGMCVLDDYRGAIPLGKHYYYYESGVLKELREYQDTLILVTVFNEKGKKLSAITYRNAKLYSEYYSKTKPYLRPAYECFTKHGNALYFDTTGTVINEPSITIPAQWTDLKLEGCDATSFYIDSKGRYGLGTGSSGGVYLSKDKGQTWCAKNEGIGPVHVSHIGEFKGKMYIEIPAITLDEYAKIYQFKNGRWIFYSLSKDCLELVLSLEKEVDKNALKSNFIYKKIYLFGDYYNNAADRFKAKYFEESPHSIVAAKDSSNISAFLFSQPGGNYISTSDSTGVLYGKSGVYTHLKDSVFLLPTAGLNATDVREIFIDSRKNTWAISGLGDVYKYNANGWKKVFDYYVQQKDRTTLGSLTCNFNECDSAIIFSSLGELWIVENDVLKKFEIIDNPFKETYGFSGKSKSDFFLLGFNKTISTKSFISHYKNGQWTIIRDSIFKDALLIEGNSILKKSPTGDVWLFSDEKIVNLNSGLTLKFTEEESTIKPTDNTISFNSMGDFVFAYSEEEFIFYTSKDGFVKKRTQRLAGLTSLALSNEGELYAGTGYDFLVMCAMYSFGKAQGLFKLDENRLWQRIENNVNPWIMSLKMIDSKAFIVGTSGTGLQKVVLK